MKTLLVFPSCIEASLAVLAEARSWGWRVVGASSIGNDPYTDRYDAWVKLPYINDASFFPTLTCVVARFDIDTISAPHAPSFLFLHSNLSACVPRLRLRGPNPYDQQMRWAEEALADAAEKLRRAESFSGGPSPLSPKWLAAVLTRAQSIYGESRQEKLVAMAGIFSSAPPGDVVEIGSFFGKSTYVLNRLASRYGLGLTLAVDPWDQELSVQHDSPDNIRKLSGMWNWESVFEGFLLTMQACSIPPFNYMRTTSEQAWKRYVSGTPVSTPEFGETTPAGSISVLHIDANHDEAAVALDLSTWSRRLASGGWIVLDDYEWSQGNGPRQVGDRAIMAFGDRLRHRFVAGGALFMKVD